jgi:hypothetical protein
MLLIAYKQEATYERFIQQELSQGSAERLLLNETDACFVALHKQIRKRAGTSQGAPGQSVEVLMYIDGANELAKPLSGSKDYRKDGTKRKQLLDYLADIIHELLGQTPLFVIYLSTKPSLTPVRPKPVPMSRSARWVEVEHELPAPITETPFDCFDEDKNEAIDADRLMPYHPSDVVYLSLFGRPMYVPGRIVSFPVRWHD